MMGRIEIEHKLEQLKKHFAPGTYNLVTWNCHMFCQAFLDSLGVSEPIPKEYTRIGSGMRGVWTDIFRGFQSISIPLSSVSKEG